MAVGQEGHVAKVKKNLSRDHVPSTPTSGYPLSLDGAYTLQLNAAWQAGCQTEATREQPLRAAKRQKGQPIALQADCGPSLQLQSDDFAIGLGIDHMTTDTALAAWTNQLLPQHEEAAVAQMPWLPTHKIHLSMECVASTSFVRVMKAKLFSMHCFAQRVAYARPCA